MEEYTSPLFRRLFSAAAAPGEGAAGTGTATATAAATAAASSGITVTTAVIFQGVPNNTAAAVAANAAMLQLRPALSNPQSLLPVEQFGVVEAVALPSLSSVSSGAGELQPAGAPCVPAPAGWVVAMTGVGD